MGLQLQNSTVKIHCKLDSPKKGKSASNNSLPTVCWSRTSRGGIICLGIYIIIIVGLTEWSQINVDSTFYSPILITEDYHKNPILAISWGSQHIDLIKVAPQKNQLHFVKLHRISVEMDILTVEWIESRVIFLIYGQMEEQLYQYQYHITSIAVSIYLSL